MNEMVDQMMKEAPRKTKNEVTVEMICINKKEQDRSVRRPSKLEGTYKILWGHIRDIWDMDITLLRLLCFSQNSLC